MLTTVLLLGASTGYAKDWYVSAQRGAGREGTKANPTKDLGLIASQLQAGDRVFIAAGKYLGRGENGADTITVPVEIQGGFSDDFSQRDPWKAFKTVFTGSNKSDNFSTATRLSIDTTAYSTNLAVKAHKVVVEGIIFDNAERNTYANSSENKIIRKGNGSDKPSPESGALSITTGFNGDILVRNNIALNTAPTVGVFAFFPGRSAKVDILNNSAVNNTGVAYHLSKSYFSEVENDQPRFNMQNNVAIFTQKYDPFATFGGSSVMLEAGTKVAMLNNVFAMNDFYGIDNARRAKNITLKDNLFMGNLVADYLEFNTKVKLRDIADIPENLSVATGNRSANIKLPISAAWASKYFGRNIIDRAAVEGASGGLNTTANDLRSILGLPLQGAVVNADSDIWLPRISFDDAAKVSARYAQNFGCFTPIYK